MRVRSSRVALLSLPVLVHSVSLSDFSPRADNLPTDCQALYVQQIDGCQASDFTSSAGCSASCVNALEDLVWPIKSACGDEGLSGENVIVAYLANQGPSQLCHDAPTVIASEVAASSAAEQSTATGTTAAGTTASTTSAPTTAAGTSIQFIASTTAQPASTSTTATSDGDTSSTITTTATITMATLSPTQSASDSITTTSTALMVDTSSPPTLASATITQTTTASGSSQTSNSGHSGGGSPFDSNGNVSDAASLHKYGSIAAVWLAVALGAWIGLR